MGGRRGTMGQFPEVPSHPSSNLLPAPPQQPGRGPNLEVGLLEDAGQLSRRAALLGQLRQVPQDLLHQLQVVVPHGLQLRLLQPLVGLGVGAEQVKLDASPRALGYQTAPHPCHQLPGIFPPPNADFTPRPQHCSWYQSQSLTHSDTSTLTRAHRCLAFSFLPQNSDGDSV